MHFLSAHSLLCAHALLVCTCTSCAHMHLLCAHPFIECTSIYWVHMHFSCYCLNFGCGPTLKLVKVNKSRWKMWLAKVSQDYPMMLKQLQEGNHQRFRLSRSTGTEFQCCYKAYNPMFYSSIATLNTWTIKSRWRRDIRETKNQSSACATTKLAPPVLFFPDTRLKQVEGNGIGINNYSKFSNLNFSF